MTTLITMLVHNNNNNKNKRFLEKNKKITVWKQNMNWWVKYLINKCNEECILEKKIFLKVFKSVLKRVTTDQTGVKGSKVILSLFSNQNTKHSQILLIST